jgi:hypothetical protein
VTPSSIPRRASRVETRRPRATARRERDLRRISVVSVEAAARARSINHSFIHSFIGRSFRSTR